MTEKHPPVFGLVCSGGGAHGAYQVGVLKYIHEKFSDGERSPFQIFAGCSCGSLNTSFYAAQSYDARASRLWLEDLWMNFHVPEYHGNLFKSISFSLLKEWRRSPEKRHTAWAFLDPSAMLDVIARGFLRRNLEKAFDAGTTRGIAVAATELLSARSCWFLEGENATSWNFFHSIGITDRVTGTHLAASCSIPIFMPPVKIGCRYFSDGSVRLNRPFSPAINMGATRILNIATDVQYPAELPNYPPDFHPRFSNVVRMVLNCLNRDTAEGDAIDIEMLNRFYEIIPDKHKHHHAASQSFPLVQRKTTPSQYHPVKVHLFYPSKRLHLAGRTFAADASSDERGQATHFMFHRRFIREMIDLGYDDARAKHDELKSFFTEGEKKQRWGLF